MKLLLIRHGQSVNNGLEGSADYAALRQPDPPLTALGQQQMERTALALASGHLGEPVIRLYTSLMTRGIQSAAPLAAALNLPVQGLTLAYECGGLNTGPAGQFQPVAGPDVSVLRRICPALQWPDDLLDQPWEGGCEPWEAATFAQRAAQVAQTLRAQAEAPGLVCLITHHDFAQFLMAELLGLPQLDLESLVFRLNHASLSLLETGPGRTTLHWLNRTDHLLTGQQSH